MGVLAAATYDPATAVVKAATAALALTALDTTNLRAVFTVPASGRVQVHMRGVMHGSTTYAQLMMGVLEGTTVRGRTAARQTLGGTALATTLVHCEAIFIVSGLTAGAVLTWDAAYGVETVGGTGAALKYGGPNNATANDAFGAFLYEVWPA